MTFDNTNTCFGFGCMRLKLDDNGKVDYKEFEKMIDIFMENGFTYFDTARVYIGGQSETAIRDCLVKRYDRKSFTITDKLSDSCFNKEEEIRPFFYSQLESLGVEYLDYYLMHALNVTRYEKYRRTHAFEIAKELKDEGKIKHIGISFHDSPEVLDKILTEMGDYIEVVQIQYNYLDLENPNVQSEKCYEVAKKHNKPIIVMEPIKGGTLIDLPEEAKPILNELQISNANLALRFVADHSQVFMILSGMGSVEMMKENISFMKEPKPLSEKEKEATKKINTIIKNKNMIPCTGCSYCTPGCPMSINIPEIFKIRNSELVYRSWNAKNDYKKLTLESGLASSCIQCGQCERICPQQLRIRKELKDIAQAYEKE